MGLLINGIWQEHETELPKEGRFERKESSFRNWVTPDGRPGPSGHDGFRAMAGRYHLYVSLACPWAHRALIVRAQGADRSSVERAGRDHSDLSYALADGGSRLDV